MHFIIVQQNLNGMIGLNGNNYETNNTYKYSMKNIKNYINEKLHVTTNSFYSCQPKTKDELKEIIIQRIQEDGPECDLNDIDVSKITDMSDLFNAYTYVDINGLLHGNKIFRNFNGDISQWDVSNVKNMEAMFYHCVKFNCDISKWDVSNVNNIDYMFSMCMNFKQNINDWDVSNVKSMAGVFYKCPTQPKWHKEYWEQK